METWLGSFRASTNFRASMAETDRKVNRVPEKWVPKSLEPRWVVCAWIGPSPGPPFCSPCPCSCRKSTRFRLAPRSASASGKTVRQLSLDGSSSGCTLDYGSRVPWFDSLWELGFFLSSLSLLISVFLSISGASLIRSLVEVLFLLKKFQTKSRLCCSLRRSNTRWMSKNFCSIVTNLTM